MCILYCMVCVLLLSPDGIQATDQCPDSRVSNLKLSLTSRRNETGHWVVKSDLFNTAPLQQGAATRQVSLDVEQGNTVCGGAESTHLTTTVAIPVASSLLAFELFPGLGYYKFHTTALTWEEAQATCVREGAHLLVINSVSEAVVVKEFFARSPKILNATHTNAIYLGIHDRYEEGQWLTVLGKPLTFTGWNSGEPNGKTGENCGFALKTAVWGDIQCSDKISFICEKI